MTRSISWRPWPVRHSAGGRHQTRRSTSGEGANVGRPAGWGRECVSTSTLERSDEHTCHEGVTTLLGTETLRPDTPPSAARAVRDAFGTATPRGHAFGDASPLGAAGGGLRQVKTRAEFHRRRRVGAGCFRHGQLRRGMPSPTATRWGRACRGEHSVQQTFGRGHSVQDGLRRGRLPHENQLEAGKSRSSVSGNRAKSGSSAARGRSEDSPRRLIQTALRPSSCAGVRS